MAISASSKSKHCEARETRYLRQPFAPESAFGITAIQVDLSCLLAGAEMPN
jgi:hypothetical protein